MNNSFFEYRNIHNESLPNFGFKIHISATIYNYKYIFSIIEALLEEQKIAYKFIKNDEDVHFNFSVKENSAETGKFITIYPKNNDEFHSLLDLLYKNIPIETEGIYILSDRPYKDSQVIFYRFGTIKLDIHQTENGIPTLYSSDGRYWQDYQRTYFDLPEWIEDIQEDTIIEDSYLSQNYIVTDVLSLNSGGNVYRGQSLKNKQCVILKESRPHIIFVNQTEKSHLRNNEFEITKQLNQYVPKCIEKVEEWINSYYIYEDIQGKNLYDYLKSYTIFSYSSKDKFQQEINILKMTKFIHTIEKVIKIVRYFHEKNIILNDIHPENFVVDFYEDIYFIDLEHSYHQNTLPITGIFNDISLKEWNKIDGKLSDCHKIANMILYTFARIQLKEGEIFNSLLLTRLLRNSGIESNLPNLVSYLLSPAACIDTALKIVTNIIVEPYHHDYFLDISNILSQDYSDKYDYIVDCPRNSENLHLYLQNTNDDKYLQLLIDSERKFGIDGLLGVLLVLHRENLVSRLIIEYGINTIIKNLVDTSYGKMIPIVNNNASPYLINGNAGLIRVLMEIDIEKYRETIIDLSDTLQFEFAQKPSYYDGMLGIAETLILVFEKVIPKQQYLFYAKKLLIHCFLYLDTKQLDSCRFYSIVNLYKEISNETTL